MSLEFFPDFGGFWKELNIFFSSYFVFHKKKSFSKGFSLNNLEKPYLTGEFVLFSTI